MNIYRRPNKWYENRTLLLFLLLTVYPIGLIGLWMKRTTVGRKVAFSVAGFFGWIWFCIIALAVTAAITAPGDYEEGVTYMEEKNWQQAVNSFERVEAGNDEYNLAQEQLKEARQKLAEEERQRKMVRSSAVSEVKNHVDSLVANERAYTVLLYDMNLQENGADTTFQHKYKVVRQKPDGMPYETITDWQPVSDTTFDFYIHDLGMALLSSDGVETNEISSPPGYDNYVGNPTYGQWRTNNDGDSFWEFYGKYALIRTMFGYPSPVYRYSYDDYNDYYRRKSSYYGRPSTSGRGYMYGSNSPAARQLNPTNNFRGRVQQRVSRSPSRFNSLASYRSNPNNAVSRSSTRISRSPSRSSSIRGGSSSSRGGK